MQVFAVTELLDNILLQLPLRNLLLAQRVDCTWRDTIQTSPQIQQAFFFRPHSISLVKVAGFRTPMRCASRDECPLGDYGDKDYQTPLRWKSETTGSTVDYVVRNPLLPLGGGGARTIHLMPGGDKIIKQPAWKRPEASWRSMLSLSQHFKRLLLILVCHTISMR